MFVILSISRRIREGRKNLRLRHFFRLPAHILQQSGQGWNESQDAPVPDGVLRALWHALSTDRVGRRDRNPHQVARKHISPFWGKCGLRANLALSSFEPRPMCKMAVLAVFSFTDYRFLALAGKFISGFFNKNVTLSPPFSGSDEGRCTS